MPQVSNHDVRAIMVRLDRQDAMLTTICTALKGDDLGNLGIVARLGLAEKDIKARSYRSEVELLSKQVSGHDRKIWLVSTVLGAAWATLVVFKDNLFGK